MSSPTPTWSERRGPPRAAPAVLPAPLRAAPALRRAAAALLVALLVVILGAPAGAARAAPATVPLPVAAVRTGGDRTSLIVDLGASTGGGRRTVSVTRDGVPEPARLAPVMADGLAVTLVVDTSAAGAALLPAWLSAGARFVLEAPDGAQAAVVADTTPASLIAGPQREPAEVVRALHAVRAGGGRDTAAALALAIRQLPATPAGGRLVVLYTTAPDAGGDSAAELAARFRASGTMLVVVGVAEAGRYWTDAAAATGGFFAPAGDPVVVPALDQVRTTLNGRHLVEFPTPPRLPAAVSVRVGTGDLLLTADVVVPAPVPAAAPAARSPALRIAAVAALAAAALVVLLAVVLFLLRRRRARRGTLRPEASAQRPQWADQPTGAMGRAAPAAAGGPPPAPQSPPRAEGRVPAPSHDPQPRPVRREPPPHVEGRAPAPHARADVPAPEPPHVAGRAPAPRAPDEAPAPEPPPVRGRVVMPSDPARGRATVRRPPRKPVLWAPADTPPAPAPPGGPDDADPE